MSPLIVWVSETTCSQRRIRADLDWVVTSGTWADRRAIRRSIGNEERNGNGARRATSAAGLDEIEVAEKARTVGELLDALTARIGTEFRRTMLDSRTNELSANLILLVNGHSVRMLNGLKTPLLETDVVTIDTVELLEIVGGG